MNTKSIIISVVSAIIGISAATAQNTYSGYFIDNYAYRYQMNPAYANEENLVAFPVLGNVNLKMEGSLNLKDVIYTYDGQKVLFTNPNIPVTDVMRHIDDVNKVGVNLRLDIVNVGFKAFGGYNTVGVNMRANVNVSVPGDFFRLAKEGVSNRTYDISNFQASSNTYAEIALGHSRKINDKWRVGGTLKFMLGVANIDAQMNKASLVLGEDNWTATTDATVYSSVKGLRYNHKFNKNTNHEYVSGLDIDKFGVLNGFGLGLDLGAVYNPFRDWEFSASVLDLGFISWGNTQVASTNGERTIETDAYIFNADKDAPNSFENEFDKFKDNLANLYELEDNGNMGSRNRMLTATLNFGARYTLPVYRNLKFGLLSTTRINGKFTTSDVRLSANVTPVKWFSADANLGIGTYGCSFGWLVNFKAPIFNFFVGMDRLPGKFAKQGFPLSSNAQVNLGINFLF